MKRMVYVCFEMSATVAVRGKLPGVILEPTGLFEVIKVVVSEASAKRWRLKKSRIKGRSRGYVGVLMRGLNAS
jgi:hypothetical protein